MDPPPPAGPPLSLLEATHTFPGPYDFKAFGPGTEGFAIAVECAAVEIVGAERVTCRVRATRSGRKTCVSVTAVVERAEQVQEIYQRLTGVPGVFLIL